MPSINVDMTTSPSVLAAEKKNAKIIPTLLMVDNALGIQDAVLTLVDRFLPSVTNGVAVPTIKTETRLAINVSMAACVSLKDELKDIEFLGAPEVAVATPDANCKVTMAFHYK